MGGNPVKKHTSPSAAAISRRDFLAKMGVVVAGSVLAGCAPKLSTIAPTSHQPPPSRPLVALAQAASYDRTLIRQQVQTLFDGLGGVKDIVSTGSKVVIKINLTGGVNNPAKNGGPAVENHVTHPEVVRAVGELLLDAGAGSIYLVEAFADDQSVLEWGYTDIARSLDAELIDLNQAAPYPDFATLPVGTDYYIYENFLLNHILEEADCFVSIAKMKTHCTAGITLAMKNLVGITPMQFYKQSPSDINRTSLHGSEVGNNTRLPRVIVDLNRARPIDLAVLDGISTIEGGEGPWNIYNKQVKPGLLIAGKNALATDAVATSVMGFDPTSEAPDAPFLQSDNYFNLAYSQSLGTNRLEDIDTVGAVPTDVRFPFAACTEW